MTRKQLQMVAGFLLLSLLLSSCETGKKQSSKVQPPVVQAPVPEPPAPPLPLPAPHTSLFNLSPEEVAFVPVEEIISRSETKFLEGEKNLKAGYLLKAKTDFDSSLEIILRSGHPVHEDEKLEHQYESLIDRIFGYEMASLKAGDGFNEDRSDRAPLDEINLGELPLQVDPRVRLQAEETLRDVPHDLPLVVNDMVLRFMDFFQKRGRKAMEVGMQRAGRYRPMISRILAEEGVPQDLIYLCQAESGYRPLALSVARCKGLWQFQGSRGKEYGLRQNWWIDERSDPEKSTRAAARHLKDLYANFGDWLLAMAAYNTGPMNVGRAIERTGYADYWELVKRGNLHPQTVDYIPIIIAMALISKEPQKYGFEPQPDPPIETESVQLDSAIDLRLVAESLNLSLAQVQELNPHVRRMATPRNDPEFHLYIPKGMKVRFLEQIAAIPEGKRVSWRLHQVKEGEPLATIAKKYHTTTAVISAANNLGKGENPKPGDKLIIPMTVRRSSEPTAEATSNRASTKYLVKKGDTLSSIAQDQGVGISQLRRWNSLSTASKLRIGQTLLINPRSPATSAVQTAPPQKTASTTLSRPASANADSKQRVIHKVKKGDTLSSIAANYHTTVDSLLEWNKITKKHKLQVGDQIAILK
jgi:membrane-bound lytic murein transglycosylase D